MTYRRRSHIYNRPREDRPVWLATHEGGTIYVLAYTWEEAGFAFEAAGFPGIAYSRGRHDDPGLTTARNVTPRPQRDPLAEIVAGLNTGK